MKQAKEVVSPPVSQKDDPLRDDPRPKQVVLASELTTSALVLEFVKIPRSPAAL